MNFFVGPHHLPPIAIDRELIELEAHRAERHSSRLIAAGNHPQIPADSADSDSGPAGAWLARRHAERQAPGFKRAGSKRHPFSLLS
jgi:hypothetical protein